MKNAHARFCREDIFSTAVFSIIVFTFAFLAPLIATVGYWLAMVVALISGILIGWSGFPQLTKFIASTAVLFGFALSLLFQPHRSWHDTLSVLVVLLCIGWLVGVLIGLRINAMDRKHPPVRPDDA